MLPWIVLPSWRDRREALPPALSASVRKAEALTADPAAGRIADPAAAAVGIGGIVAMTGRGAGTMIAVRPGLGIVRPRASSPSAWSDPSKDW